MPLINRFLVPAGRGAVVEPQGNPVLDFAREHLPYPGKVAEGEHGTDEFFTPATVRQILRHFDYGDSRAFRLVGMLQTMVGLWGSGYEARRQRRGFVPCAEAADPDRRSVVASPLPRCSASWWWCRKNPQAG
jgi:hypothetical protein